MYPCRLSVLPSGRPCGHSSAWRYRLASVTKVAIYFALVSLFLLLPQSSPLLAGSFSRQSGGDLILLGDRGESLNNDAVPSIARPKELPSTVYLPIIYGKNSDLAEVLAEAGQYSTFLQVLEATGQLELLHGEGPLTLLAPTDAAFDALPQGALEQLLAQLATNPEGQLTQIARFHILPGMYWSSDLIDGQSIETLHGADVSVSLRESDIYVNGAEIVERDLIGSNGLIHGISAVILPPIDHQ